MKVALQTILDATANTTEVDAIYCWKAAASEDVLIFAPREQPLTPSSLKDRNYITKYSYFSTRGMDIEIPNRYESVQKVLYLL